MSVTFWRPVPYASLIARMPSVLAPSFAIRLPRTSPWRRSDGAVRQYRFLSSQLVKSGEVFAGENSMTPAPVIWSITSLETPEAAAPMIAETPALRRFGTVVAYALLSGSPESP